MKQCSMFFGISFFHSASICFNFETISGDLAFSQCEFKSTPDDLYSQAERSIGNENFSGRFQQPVEELVQPFPRLKNLKLRSQCSKTYFRQSLYDITYFSINSLQIFWMQTPTLIVSLKAYASHIFVWWI